MISDPTHPFPPVALWRVNALRFLFLLMAFFMGSMLWMQLIFDFSDLSAMGGVATSLLAALSLLSLLGIRYPLKMLPLMLFEMTWKTVWLTCIAGRSWMAGTWSPEIEGIFYQCIGIVIVFVIMPWRYVWATYFASPMEPLFRPREAPDA
ncbi:hypothetical protein KCG44_13955 [Pacificimonas sp. WHA3]|uniref:Uncharacterized protein n=1 Tax=Pacificimonas pallii TaxID=2827236 RepID=A0ABS6SHI6_9SPHN|nr:hypothetical protein [Pacificimonas pallii]MBV7257885.1 hypothetical protein [Pacificimonas pallii]